MTDKRSSEQAAQSRESIEPPARITLLYESGDGRLCLFEDHKGHLTAVSAAKLA